MHNYMDRLPWRVAAPPQTRVPRPSSAGAGNHNRLHRHRRCRLSSTKLQRCPRDCDASTRPDKTDRLPTSLRDIGHPRRSYGRTMKYAGWIRLLVFGALLCSRAGAVGIPHFGVGDLVNSSNLIVLGGWPRSQRRSYAVEGAPGPSPLVGMSRSRAGAVSLASNGNVPTNLRTALSTPYPRVVLPKSCKFSQIKSSTLLHNILPSPAQNGM